MTSSVDVWNVQSLRRAEGLILVNNPGNNRIKLFLVH